MLVLSRKSQEQVRIGDDIVITVVRIKGNVVALGIEAPKDKRILRSELTPFESGQATSRPTMPAITRNPLGPIAPGAPLPLSAFMVTRSH
jgi:carbon storage regulator CsrA